MSISVSKVDPRPWNGMETDKKPDITTFETHLQILLGLEYILKSPIITEELYTFVLKDFAKMVCMYVLHDAKSLEDAQFICRKYVGIDHETYTRKGLL